MPTILPTPNSFVNSSHIGHGFGFMRSSLFEGSLRGGSARGKDFCSAVRH
jgi:hypothetical protein